MKKLFFLFFLILIFCSKSNANNLVIGTPTYDAISNQITFSIKWDNSWLVNTGPSNNDAVWVFVKRQPCGANGIWSHALLNTTSSSHSITGAYSLEVNTVSDGMGVFIKRSSSANNLIGSFANTSSVKLQLTNNYNPALIGSSTSSDNFKVIGIEMAYIPQGEFYIGDGRGTNTNNFSAGNTIGALLVNATTQLNGLGAYTNYVSKPIYGSVISLPNTFPLGYDGFYCMKYEINQQQIVDYLNTLNYDQQAARLAVWASTRVPSTNGTYFSNTANNFRQEIKVTTAGTNNTVAAVFGLTNSYNAYLPAGYLNWQDLSSYLDWAGLRPMTEFEFEKVARGTRAPVAYEYPWGTTVINTSSGNFSAQNTSTETSNSVYEGNCWYNWNGGPIRSGFAATATSNRSQSGASYYGIMELGGNVFEQCVGGSNYNYSSFTITNGDGLLTNTGLANVTGWPSSGGISSGTILRGGSFYANTSNNYQIQVSDRTYYAGSTINDNNTRDRSVGGRGVRSF